MALNWNFKTDYIGYADTDMKSPCFTRIYSGNALAIFLSEDDENDTYSLQTFFTNK